MTGVEPLRMLVVCTANICRSPMAHALLAAEADERGADLEVRSAGVSDVVEPNCRYDRGEYYR